ncbi:endonuclease-reverse transcriptase [Elysia marginata]|uniref:Endonuclease-reverse transcriptase n=1 Tax=Elysia marginata TaxID=1093978 RepID=A0AAV4HS97_9GAST|nr:endonuclease-reverse transcriptase [Elysia marginata]
MNLLSTRRNTSLGIWNIRTMLEASKVQQVADEIDGYHLKIVGLSEARWNQSREQTLALGHNVIYPGLIEQNKRHAEGVDVL